MSICVVVIESNTLLYHCMEKTYFTSCCHMKHPFRNWKTASISIFSQRGLPTSDCKNTSESWYFRLMIVIDWTHQILLALYVITEIHFVLLCELGMELSAWRLDHAWQGLWVAQQHPPRHRDSCDPPSFPANPALPSSRGGKNWIRWYSPLLTSRYICPYLT
jgi:hypothetical protein